jgi:hypothetical protein
MKDMESADDDTIIKLATCLSLLLNLSPFEALISCLALMHVGGNVIQAASKTVSKDIDNDPTAALEVRTEMSSRMRSIRLTDSFRISKQTSRKPKAKKWTRRSSTLQRSFTMRAMNVIHCRKTDGMTIEFSWTGKRKRLSMDVNGYVLLASWWLMTSLLHDSGIDGG